MVDIKFFKPVSSTSAGIAGSPGSFPPPLAPGASVSETFTPIGTGYSSIISSDGAVELTLNEDDTATVAAPVASFVAAIYRSTLPTYTAGDGGVLHLDDRGRLLVSSGASGLSIDVGTDDSAAPANPVGNFPLAVYRAVLPAYTDGDAAVLHTTAGGLLRVSSTPSLPATSTTSTVAGAAVTTSLLASNTSRLGATFFNEQATDGSGATLYLLLDAAVASLTNYTSQVPPNAYYEVPYGYTGEVRGIWSAAAGDVRVTELT